MTDPRDVARYEGVARIANYFGAGFGPAYAGPRPGREPPDEPPPGDHGPDPDEPLEKNEFVDEWW
jgi:hypothetical protein